MEAQRQFAVNQAVKYIKAFYGSWADTLLLILLPHCLLNVTEFSAMKKQIHKVCFD